MNQELMTRRLICEPLSTDHAKLLISELRNEHLYRFIPQNPPVDVEALEERYERLVRQPHSPDGSQLWLNWAIREQEEDAYVGVLEASVTPGQNAYIAYFVFDPYQRRGYARESVGALVDHLFEQHEVGNVVAEIDTRNIASIALVKALGFRCVAHKPDADYFKGATSHEYRFELSR